MEAAKRRVSRQPPRTQRAAVIAPLLLVLGVHELVVLQTFSADTPSKRAFPVDIAHGTTGSGDDPEISTTSKKTSASSSPHTASQEKKMRLDLTEPKTMVLLVMRLVILTEATSFIGVKKRSIGPDDDVGPNTDVQVIRMQCFFKSVVAYRDSAKRVLDECHAKAEDYYRKSGLGDVSLVMYEVKEEDLVVMSSRLSEAKGVPPESIPIFLFCQEKGEGDTKTSECHGGSGLKYQPWLQYHERNIGYITTPSRSPAVRGIPLHFDRELGDTKVKIRWENAKMSCWGDNKSIAEVIFITANGRDPPLLHGTGDETAPMTGKCKLEMKSGSSIPTASFFIERVIGTDTFDVPSSGAIFTHIDPPQLVPFVTPTPQRPANILVFHLDDVADPWSFNTGKDLHNGGKVKDVMCGWGSGTKGFATCYDRAKDSEAQAGSVFITTSVSSYLIELLRDWDFFPEDLKNKYRFVIQGSMKENHSLSTPVSYLDVAFSPALWYSYVREPVKSFKVVLIHDFAYQKNHICFSGQLSFFSLNWAAKVVGEYGQTVLHELRGYVTVLLKLNSCTLVAVDQKLELTFSDGLELVKIEEKPGKGARQQDVSEDNIEFLGCRDSLEGRSEDSGRELLAPQPHVPAPRVLKKIAIGVHRDFQVRSTRIFKEREIVSQAL